MSAHDLAAARLEAFNMRVERDAAQAEAAALREQIATAIEEFADDWSDWSELVQAYNDLLALRDVVKSAVHDAAAIARGCGAQ